MKIINKKSKPSSKIIIYMKKFKKTIKRISKKFKKNSSNMRRIQAIQKKNILKETDSYSNIQIDSPYNSNEYLIQNQSSPFYDENDEEEFSFTPNEIMKLDLYSEIKDFFYYKMDSTNDE